MDNPKNPTINHLSLCSGYEGIGLGLRAVLSNVREIAYVEREGFPCANLVAKMEAGELDAAPVFTDIKTFPYRRFRGCVDILSGGFPCQPFSSAGKRAATEDPRHLFPSIAKGIGECQPRIVFLENVEGILSCTTGDGEPVLKYVLRTLEEMGYRATAGIFSAEEVGAPHRRKRVYILADRLGAENNGKRGASKLGRNEVGRPAKAPQQSDREARPDSLDGCGQKLADADVIGGGRPRLQLGIPSTDGQGRSYTAEDRNDCQGRWPARPGEQQHEWETPRVLVNPQHFCLPTTGKHGGMDQAGEIPEGRKRGQLAPPYSESGLARKREDIRTDTSDSVEAKPRLGRATDGSASGLDSSENQTDRLRLLGNGVVPQTAALAFATLYNRLLNQ